MCLGFDVAKHVVQKVRYESRRRDPTVINEHTMRALLLTKYKDCQYEKEVRAFLSLNEIDEATGLYFYPFDEALQLNEVVLGRLCETTLSDVRAALQQYGEPITVTKSQLVSGVNYISRLTTIISPDQRQLLAWSDRRDRVRCC